MFGDKTKSARNGTNAVETLIGPRARRQSRASAMNGA